MRLLRQTLSILVFALCAFVMASAQENAEITGTVTDPSGAAVANATVSITHLSTGIMRTTQSSSTGLFDFPGLRIGTYDLKATATGFKTFTKASLVLNTAQTLRADVRLEVGSESQTVTVEANALALQTETNEVSSLITGDQVTQLATNGRSLVSLAAAGTGVTNQLQSFNGVTAQGAGST